jgi:hypothetical protein
MQLHERRAVDGDRTEVVAQGVKRQRSQLGALDGGRIAPAQRAGVQVAAGRMPARRTYAYASVDRDNEGLVAEVTSA